MTPRQLLPPSHRLGHSSVQVTRLGLGCAPLANMYRELTDADATATVDAAWHAGVRYFDTAPHYGLGLSERRLGLGLAGRHRDLFTVSTKVGRLLVPEPDGARGLDDGFLVPADHIRVWDFSADGIRRSIEGSLARLGLDRIDLVLLHDPEHRLAEALDQGYPALHELRAQGVVGAIGVGSMRVDALRRFAAATDADALMVAGRHTLLDQSAQDELLPICLERGISVLNAAVFNSGMLAAEQPGAHLRYDYGAAPAELVDRARTIASHCLRHGTTLPAAALAFAGSHPSVASVVVGAETPGQILRNAALLNAPPPTGLWADLARVGLLRPDTPVPAPGPTAARPF
ncbi:aldo/keto reductase [Streptomyces sp. NBC_00988]|nr:aldo/keto reductase [Streptomyces sp. NBC_00988]